MTSISNDHCVLVSAGQSATHGENFRGGQTLTTTCHIAAFVSEMWEMRVSRYLREIGWNNERPYLYNT